MRWVNTNGIVAQPCRSGIVRGGEVRRRIGVMVINSCCHYRFSVGVVIGRSEALQKSFANLVLSCLM